MIRMAVRGSDWGPPRGVRFPVAGAKKTGSGLG
jgi:hypothetical protein